MIKTNRSRTQHADGGRGVKGRRKQALPIYDRLQSLKMARETLRRPCVNPLVERPSLPPNPVADFVLPLELCPTTNRTGRHGFASQPWKIQKIKTQILTQMLAQHGRRSEPLQGRPLVIAVRFSSRPTDEAANGAKMAIDKLTAKNGGLGFLVDDGLKHCRQKSWWEPGPLGAGFVYIAVYADDGVATVSLAEIEAEFRKAVGSV